MLGFRFVSLPAAVLLSLALAGTSLAASWSTPITVASGAFMSDLVTLEDGTALVAYEKCIDMGGGMCISKTYVKRSTDGGATWPSKWTVPGEADMAALGGRGTHVDLVWRDIGGDLSYARSNNGGVSFEPPLTLSHHLYGKENPSVARGPGGLVAVAWSEWPQFRDQVSVRVSTDGGITFGSKASWRTGFPGWSSVAAGNGVVYLTHVNGSGVPVVRRSLDGGETWATILTLDDEPFVFVPVITAVGSQAYVAYATVDADEHRDVQYRRTSDKGATWSPPGHLAPESTSAYSVDISMQGGVARALFVTDHGYFYTQSSNGLTWTEPEFVLRGSWAAYVGFAGRPIVLYEREPSVAVKARAN